MRYLMCALVLIGGLALIAPADSFGESGQTISRQRVQAIDDALNNMSIDIGFDAMRARKGMVNMKILYGKGSARRKLMMEQIVAYEDAMVGAGINLKDARLRAQAKKESLSSRMEPPPCK